MKTNTARKGQGKILIEERLQRGHGDKLVRKAEVAIVALTDVRRLSRRIPVQVNIANEEGLQTNVAYNE